MSQAGNSRRPAGMYVLTAGLWLASLVLGLAAIYYLHELVLTIYIAAPGSDGSLTGVLRWLTLFVGGIAWLIAMLAGGEYHLKHVGERKSLTYLAWTIGVELLIIVLGMFVSW